LKLARGLDDQSESYKSYVIGALRAAAGIGRNMDLWLS
jgi:hypothetical protein